MAFKKIVVLVILMTVLVYCEVAEEFSAADDDDRGQCKAETKGQHGAEKKSLYEMFSEDEESHSPDEWIKKLANDQDFINKLKDENFRKDIEKQLEEMQMEQDQDETDE